MPGKETSTVPSNTPGKVISSDAAGAVLPFSIDALVSDTYVCTFPTQLCFNIVPPQVKALHSHRLAPVLKASRVVWVTVLPGAGVDEFSVVFLHTKEIMGGVRVKGQTLCV